VRYEGAALRHFAMPLGGIGTGTLALGGEGGLRQWQLFNQINHRAFVPDSFFALHVGSERPPRDHVRILQSREALELERPGTPLVDDDFIPDEQRRLVARFGGVERTVVETAYPFVRLEYEDRELPVEVRLEAFSPFAPFDPETSGVPAAVFAFSVRNRSDSSVHGQIAATLQNAVGWDGVTPIEGARCSLFGGNVNRLERRPDRVALVLDNPSLAPDAGQMTLAALDASARALERWTSGADFIAFLRAQGEDEPPASPQSRVGPSPGAGASPPGQTWNAGLAVPFRLAPGEQFEARFVFAWYFPRRQVNWLHFGPRPRFEGAEFDLGNEYATRFSSAIDVVDHVQRDLERLQATGRCWADLFADGSLPAALLEGMAVQAAGVRTPVCFRTRDGAFFGFEGGNGAATVADGRAFGGSCPLNCTHVWNYAQTVAHLYPQLERSMRETELETLLHRDGYLPHRVILPLYLPQLERDIGGPDEPALDGMLGCVLKVCREVQLGAGPAWLERLWPAVRRLVLYVAQTWDADGDGVLRGEQPNTYDIAFRGAEPFVGVLWLAALRAAAALARIAGDIEFAGMADDLFERASPAYDQLLWNGSYYVQRLDPGDSTADQYGEGCLADQLLGQWWAHELALGYLLPQDHVREALRSIVRNNLHPRLGALEHRARVFGDAEEAGLLLCTWPEGGRPHAPVDYCDEVWTGIEYQVAAHCLREGLVVEAHEILAALHSRYSGVRRNPFNHVECGDHYVRALAGWSVLRAFGGVGYDAVSGTLRLHDATPPDGFRGPWVAGQSFGRLERVREGARVELRLTCTAGELDVRELALPSSAQRASFLLDGSSLGEAADKNGVLALSRPFTLRAGSELAVAYELTCDPSYTVGHVPMRSAIPAPPGDAHESR
jgi:non-lysosomal glucosylceramidase